MRAWSEFTPGVLPGARETPPVQDAPQLATVLTVTAAGATFELDATPGHSYGPAPWCLGTYDTAALAITGGFAPQASDRCAIVFCGSGIDSPVLLSWWR